MTAARPAMVSAGVLLVVVALRSLIQVRRPPSDNAIAARTDPLARISGATLWHAARLARRTDWFHHRADDTELCTRLAVAPQCWPARCIAVAHCVAAARTGAPAADLADLMRGLRLCSASVLGLLGACGWPLLGPIAGMALAALCAASGALLPDLALTAAARRAIASSARDAATVIDIIAAASAAGLGLVDALQLAAAHVPPAHAAALRAGALRLATGVDPRSALVAEAARFGLPALADAGEAVDRRRRLGAPLGAELHAIATRHRADHRTRLMERAARRAPLGTLVVALVIAPVCLAALTACLVGGLIESGGLPLH